MRRGRWLYHPDQYTEQNPVFQVKKAAVRLSAYTAGQQVPLEVLVGDNPGDPGAYWAPWQLNDQTIILEDGQSTQAIIVNAGWYRVDTTAITGTDAMVWVEDQENTMDDWALPVQIIRPGCGGDGGQTIPPNPIMVTCEELTVLLRNGGLVPDQWYGITTTQPVIDSGQVVYVKAVDVARLEQHGAFYGPTLTADGALWPCKLDFSGPCTIVELHDTTKDNLVATPWSIAQWPWDHPQAFGNTVRATDITLDIKSQMVGCNLYSGRVSVTRGAFVGLTEVFESSLVADGRVWLYNSAVRHQASMTLDGGSVATWISVEDVTVETGGNFYLTGPSTIAVPIRVSRGHVTSRGEFLGRIVTAYNIDAIFGGIEIRRFSAQDFGIIDIGDQYGARGRSTLEQLHAHSGGQMMLRYVSSAVDISVTEGAYLYVHSARQGTAATSGFYLSGLSFRTNARGTFVWAGPTDAANFQSIRSVHVEDQSGFYMYYTPIATVMGVNCESNSRIQVWDYTRSKRHDIYNFSTSGNGTISITTMKANGGDYAMSSVSAHSSSTITIDGSPGVYRYIEARGASIVRMELSIDCVFSGITCDADGRFRHREAERFNYRAMSIRAGSNYDFDSNLTLTSGWTVDRIALDGGAISIFGTTTSVPSCTLTQISVYQGTVGITLASQQAFYMSRCTFTAGAVTYFGMNNPAFVVLQGLYAHGLNPAVNYNVTTGITGARTANF